ncbi:UNKNOWN [Stylonychia lemnae]|uniref:Leucine Rich Repeat family protein n=1 Tax=Stylonychia lemnae TaxID=5949 RepID=A0A078ARH1_STYLE|nr:UNKNOWN [Stylonychia lemnae]|eukprot:CDW85055.1 UNKNOWN [Stylonychia lemnae]
MDKEQGKNTLYEIQALLNAQDLKRAHRSFVELCPDVLNKQQQELNRRRLRLSRHNASKVPMSLDINNTVNNQSFKHTEGIRDISPNTNVLQEQQIEKSQTMFHRVNKYKNAKVIVSQAFHLRDKSQSRYNKNQSNLKRNNNQFQTAPNASSLTELPQDLQQMENLNELSLTEIVNQGKQSALQKRPLGLNSAQNSQNNSFVAFQPQRNIITPMDRQQRKSCVPPLNGRNQTIESMNSISRPPRDKSRLNEGQSVERKQQIIRIRSRQGSAISTHNNSTIFAIDSTSNTNSTRDYGNQPGPLQLLRRQSTQIGKDNQSVGSERDDSRILVSRRTCNSQLQNLIEFKSNISNQQWVNLYEARSEDLGLKQNHLQLERFIKLMEGQKENRLELRDMGFEIKSAKVLAQILKSSSKSKNITQVDLSMNKFGGESLKILLDGLKFNRRIVSLKLQNNQITADDQKTLYSFIKDHPSLVNIDLGNSDINKQRNKLGNQGFQSIVNAIVDSQNSLMSMLNIQLNQITDNQILVDLLTYKQSQIVSLNLSDNDLGVEFFEKLGPYINKLTELNLSNTKLNNRSCIDLSLALKENKFFISYLNLSRNQITSEGVHKVLNSLKNNQYLTRLDLSYNDLHNYSSLTIFENFFSQNRHLECLSLNNCKLDLKGITIISKALRRNVGLKTLNLSSNQFNDEGLYQLTQSLLDNTQNTIAEIDLSRNSLELRLLEGNKQLTQSFIEYLRVNKSLKILNIKDNLVRDKEAQIILNNITLNQSNQMIVLFDMNPCSHNIMKEFQRYNKDMQNITKEQEIPQIKDEIENLRKQHEQALVECQENEQSFIDKSFETVSSNRIPKSKRSQNIIETTELITHQIKQFQRAKTITQEQFQNEDQDLEHLKLQENKKFKQLKKEREILRQKRIDLDFEDERLDLRVLTKEKDLKKQYEDLLHKIDVVKLAQQKCEKESKIYKKDLEKKKESHQLQKDAWRHELEQIEKEQSITVLIYENYVKEIQRVKAKQQLEIIEETKNQNHQQQDRFSIENQENVNRENLNKKTQNSLCKRSNMKKKTNQRLRQVQNLNKPKGLESNKSMLIQCQLFGDQTQEKRTSLKPLQRVSIGNTMSGTRLMKSTDINVESPTNQIKDLKKLKRRMKNQFKEEEDNKITKKQFSRNSSEKTSNQKSNGDFDKWTFKTSLNDHIRC